MSNYDTAKQALRRADPSVVLRTQPLSDWRGDFPLPEAVVEYYSEFGPVDLAIEGYGNPYFLPSLARLWEHQDGYRYEKRLLGNKRLKDWDDDWLVIADEGADPFIFSRSSGLILHAYHGEGVWEPTAAFHNLTEMATTFATLGEIVAAAGLSFTDDNSHIRSQYREEVRQRIAEFVNSQDRVGEILSVMGWDLISPPDDDLS